MALNRDRPQCHRWKQFPTVQQNFIALSSSFADFRSVLDSSVTTGFRPITPELVEREFAALPLIKVEPIVPVISRPQEKLAKPHARKVVYLHTDTAKTDSSADEGCSTHSPYERSPVGSDMEDPAGNVAFGARKPEREPSAVERRRLARTKLQRNPARRQA